MKWYLIALVVFIALPSFKKINSDPTLNESIKISLLSKKLSINELALKIAINGYAQLKKLGKLSNDRYLTITDFSKPSSEKRLFIIDMEKEETIFKTFVAHGRNSGLLFAKIFSNIKASNQSSLGFYITGNSYQGKNGETLKLNGIESGINDQANVRAIVLHGAKYVSPEIVKKQGYLGRSLGCPAVPSNEVKQIIEIIKGASCLFIYAPDIKYLKMSKFI